MRVTLLCALLACAPLPAAEPAAKADPNKALAVLKDHCYRCHGRDGSNEGGLNSIADPVRLAARRKLVPGKPDASPILKRIAEGSMPPEGETPRVSKADLELLRTWVAQGAEPPAGSAKPAGDAASRVLPAILADLEKTDRRSRRFQRYFSLANLADAGLADDELQTYRLALNKLTNSLSWHPKLKNPVPIDPAGLVMKIDLRWYLWDAAVWNRILADYPYALLDESLASRAASAACATQVPVVRLDWFVATASRPPLYQEILLLPGNLAEIERQIRVDVGLNLQQERVSRVAFNGSGISRNNRVLERHDSAHGYYWRTYDFEEVPQNLAERGVLAPDRRNVFAYPLGPGGLDNQFLHAGGEAIFRLPNGLQGYYIMNAVNERLDKAPTAIVADPRRPDKAVELGVSCMGCHVTGILPKADQVRDYLVKNPKTLAKADRELALALYPDKEKSLALMADDAKLFLEALRQTGNTATKNEVVSAMTLRYEADIDISQAAGDLGVTVAEFRAKILGSANLGKSLGALAVDGGTISRAVWVAAFADAAREAGRGDVIRAGAAGPALPDNTGDLDPLEAFGGLANHATFTPDRRKVVLASPDRAMRIVDVETGREQKSLVGHTASVWATAVSPDGTLLASGGVDKSVRVWKFDGGEQVANLEGHDAMVTALAFLPDNLLASGGLDGSVIVWDVAAKKEARRWDGKGRFVGSMAATKDGGTLYVGIDGKLWKFDLAKNEPATSADISPSSLSAMALSGDERTLFVASDDGSIRAVDTESLKPGRTYQGHVGSVRSLEVSPDGKHLLSAGADRTVRLWQVADGKELAAFRKHGDSVARAAFVNDSQTVSVGRDGKPLIWNVSKFAPDTTLSGANTEQLRFEILVRVPLDGTIGAFFLNEKEGSVTAFDRTNARLVRISSQGKIGATADVPAPAVEAASVSNASPIWVAAGGAKAGKGGVYGFDWQTLRPIRSFPMKSPPLEVVLYDGWVWASTAEGFERFEAAGANAHVVTAAEPGGGLTLFGGQSWWRGQVWHALAPVSAVPRVPQPKTLEAPPGAGWWSPGWGWAVARSGLRISPEDDPVKAKPFSPFTAVYYDHSTKKLWLMTPTGWLERWDLPNWEKPAGRWKLGVTATALAVDAKRNVAWVGVIDPDTVMKRPRATGYGDVWKVVLPK